MHVAFAGASPFRSCNRTLPSPSRRSLGPIRAGTRSPSRSSAPRSSRSFIAPAIAAHLATAVLLDRGLRLFWRCRLVPLEPLPALHSLAMAVASAAIFLGFLSAVAEIRDTRWFWRRSKTPLQWLLCFTLGTRPTGCVFFWSYAFYLSRFLHLLHTFIAVLTRRELTFYRLVHLPILLCISFLLLEFSQSFQVVAILCTTLVYSILYAHRFRVAVGRPEPRFPVVPYCQVLLLCCNLVCHFGFLLLRFRKEGCNGMGVGLFNSFLNAMLLALFLNHLGRRSKDQSQKDR